MTQKPRQSSPRKTPIKLFARTATGAALAIALGCGLVPAAVAPVLSPVQAWAETANTTAPTARGVWNFNTEGQANKNTGSDTNLNLALTSQMLKQAT